MLIDTKTIDSVKIIYLKGSIDIYNYDKIEKKLYEIIQKDNNDILLNLEDIEYMNSSGLRVFISVMRKLLKEKRKLKLCNANSDVKNLFKVIQLIDIFDLHSNEADAIESFKKDDSTPEVENTGIFEQTA